MQSPQCIRYAKQCFTDYECLFFFFLFSPFFFLFSVKIGKHYLDNRRVRRAHRQCRRTTGALPGDLRGGVRRGAAAAAHRHCQAVPQATGGDAGQSTSQSVSLSVNQHRGGGARRGGRAGGKEGRIKGWAKTTVAWWPSLCFIFLFPGKKVAMVLDDLCFLFFLWHAVRSAPRERGKRKGTFLLFLSY